MEIQMSEPEVLRSPLHDHHVSAGAVMGQRDRWDVPLRYAPADGGAGAAAAEADAARTRAGAFDVTPWGRIRIRGAGAAELLGALAGPEALRQEDDTVCAAAFQGKRVQSPSSAAEDGYSPRFPSPDSPVRLVRLADFWLVLTESCDRAAALEILQQAAAQHSAKVDDQTRQTAMIAVVGPDAPRLLDAVLPIKMTDLPDGHARAGSVLIARYIALHNDLPARPPSQSAPLWRMEVILPTMLAGRAWTFLTQKAGAGRVAPCGMEAMDLLRGGA
jgi:aminomethyltransferase